MAQQDELEYMRDLRAAAMVRPSLSANLLLLSIFVFVGFAVFWADHASLDQVTSGQGRVIPSGQIQTIQNLEGGIIDQILVSEGQVIKKDQVLFVIDDTQAQSSYLENRKKYLGFLAASARLLAETKGEKPVFPEEVKKEAPEMVSNELALLRARSENLASGVSVLRSQESQKRQESIEAESKIAQFERGLALAQDEKRILEPLVASGVSSKLEFIQLQGRINELQGSLTALRAAIPRTKSAITEASERIQEREATFRQEAQAQYNDVQVSMAALLATMQGTKDRLRRTEVRSPVDGIIKQLFITTIGGIIKPGMDIAAVVPIADNLLVEAKVRPSDIAFLHPGQKAKVKITAYDYAIYGALDAEVTQISADSIADEKNESFFKVRVRTFENVLRKGGKEMPIIPGMVAEVDVINDRRTVLQYLLQPILHARDTALRER